MHGHIRAIGDEIKIDLTSDTAVAKAMRELRDQLYGVALIGFSLRRGGR